MKKTKLMHRKVPLPEHLAHIRWRDELGNVWSDVVPIPVAKEIGLNPKTRILYYSEGGD